MRNSLQFYSIKLFSLLIVSFIKVDALSTLDNIAIQNDDKILGVGYHTQNDIDQLFVVRLNSDGTNDSAFATSGQFLSPLSGSSRAHAVTVKTTGEIVVVGTHGTNYLIMQLTSTGTLDTTFNSIGYVSVPVGDGAALYDVAIDASGNIVATGAVIMDGGAQLLTVRYTSIGDLDTSFNSTGQVITDTGEFAIARGLRIQSSDGKIVIAGGAATQGLVARYNTNGSLDTTFNVTGIVKTSIGSFNRYQDVAIDASGNIVVAGTSDRQSVVARYTSVGSLDTTFDSDGYATFVNGETSQFNGGRIQSDGKILVGGFVDSQYQLARYETNGTLDSSFGEAGAIQAQIENNDDIVGIDFQADDRMIIAVNTDTAYYFARYTTVGAIDSTFGDLGNELTSPGIDPTFIEGNNYLFAYSTVLQSLNVSLAAMMFHTIGQVNGWSADVPETNFICNQVGRYNIVYDLTISREIGAPSVTVALFVNGNEVAGSQQVAQTRGVHEAVAFSNSVITTIDEGDILQVRAAGSGGNAILFSDSGEGGVRPSIRLTITRLQ